MIYAKRWLWLGVFAIAAAGIYSLVPVIGRTPQFKSLPIAQQLFDVALVVHVDLSVLVWFLAMLGMGVATIMVRHASRWPLWQAAGFWCTAVATGLMAASPLGAWVPVKSNYIPVLHNEIFLFSLALLMAGLLVTFIPPVLTYFSRQDRATLDVAELGWLAAAWVALLGFAGYALGGYMLPPGLELLERYEILFWGGGHIMQFAYTLVAMAAWLTVLAAMGGSLPPRRPALWAYGLAIAGAVASAVGFALHPIDTSDFTLFQTRMMIEVGGLGASLMAVLVVWKLCKTPCTRAVRAYWSSLIVSLWLFFAGGALGLMIVGQNVTIPAHYHGMIVGITQALMGLAYVMLPRVGYRDMATTRLAFLQPIVYGVGQTMHIGGLAYCGGYGILRKTAGGFENLPLDVKIALGIFGAGGLIAITGGVLFVIVMLRAGRRSSVSYQLT